MQPNKPLNGFTLVEMLVIAPIVLLTIAGFIASIIFLTGEALQARASSQIRLDVQRAADIIEQDVRSSTGFLAVGNVAVVSPQGKNNSSTTWTNISPSSLILDMVATSGGANANSRKPVYLPNTPRPCNDANVVENDLMTYNIVYFINNDSLYRRVIMPSNYATAGCVTHDQRSSCASTTHTACVVLDSKLLDNVQSFEPLYLNASQASAPIVDASDSSLTNTARQNLLDTVNTLQVTLISSKQVAGQSISHSHRVFVTRQDTKI